MVKRKPTPTKSAPPVIVQSDEDHKTSTSPLLGLTEPKRLKPNSPPKSRPSYTTLNTAQLITPDNTTSLQINQLANNPSQSEFVIQENSYTNSYSRLTSDDVSTSNYTNINTEFVTTNKPLNNVSPVYSKFLKKSSTQTSSKSAPPATVESKKRKESEDWRMYTADVTRHCGWEGCSEMFYNSLHLSKHVSEAHVNDESERAVNICRWKDCSRQRKPFPKRYKLLDHIRTHTGERPFACPDCDQSFSLADKLKTHRRTHTGEKPYVCPYHGCNKRYANTGDRSKHVLTHRTLKPYSCKHPGCDKSYTDPGSLRKHIRSQNHSSKCPCPSLYSEVEAQHYPPQRDYVQEGLVSNPTLLLSSASVHSQVIRNFQNIRPMDSVSTDTPTSGLGTLDTVGEVTLSSEIWPPARGPKSILEGIEPGVDTYDHDYSRFLRS